MTTARQESLNAQFEDLHAERVRTWEPGQLAKNVDARKALVAAYDPDKVVKVGDRIAAFELPNSKGGPSASTGSCRRAPPS